MITIIILIFTLIIWRHLAVGGRESRRGEKKNLTEERDRVTGMNRINRNKKDYGVEEWTGPKLPRYWR